MTQPQPMPAPSGDETLGQIFSTLAGQAGGSSGADKYGLGVWGSDQTILVGDLPIITSIFAAGKKITGDNIMQAFAGADPAALATIQRALYLGGFYGTSSKYTPTYGVIAPEDMTAFAKSVKLSGESGQTISDLLLNQAKIGTAAGIAGAQAQLSKAQAKINKPSVVDVPAKADLETAAQQAFEQTLGRKANPHEAAAFAAAYQATVVGLQRSADAHAASVAQQSVGGLTTGQASGYDQQLQTIGQPPHYSPAQLFDTDVDPEQPPGFDVQFSDLQSLGASVAATASAKTPSLVGGPSEIRVQEPPSVAVAAENFARSEHPKQAAGNDLATTFDMFLNLISTKFGG